MGSTTTNTHLRYPVPADPTDVPGDVQRLALDVDDAMSGQGTLAARPAAGNRGKRYFANDVPGHYYDDGAAWQPISGGDAPLRAYSEKKVTITGATGVVTVDLSLGTVFDITMAGNVTIVVTNPAPSGRASSALLKLRSGPGGFTWTWPSSFKWPSGVAPATSTGAAKLDSVTIETDDGGTTYLAALAGADHR